MRDVLCIYYSRTGNTKRVMETIAKEMDAELLALTDGVERSGLRGWLRSGMDAMRKDCPDVLPFETERKLENYRLVIVGTPVWAGRCSSVIRSFLKNHGGEMKRVAYVLTRGSEHKSEDIYRQMDQYTGKPHQAAHPCGWAMWATPSGRRNFSGRSGNCWRRRNSDTPFQISTFEKGAQLCWIN